MMISSAEDSDSADELNICGSQSETRSRRANSRIQPVTNSPEQKQPTSRKERNIPQSPARGARGGARAIGKQGESRVAKAVPSPSKEKERRPSRNLPSNALVPGRTVSSSRMSLHRSRSPPPNQRANRAVASTSSSRAVLRQKPSLSDSRFPTTPGDHLSFTKLVQPKKLSMTRKEESSLILSDRTGPKREDDLSINRLSSEKPDKKPLSMSQNGKRNPVTFTNYPSSSGGSGPSNSNTRSRRKRFESDGESSSYQSGVPWADLVNIPSSPALGTPKSRSTRTSKSSQPSSTFPMHFTPPDLRMKKQATLDTLDKPLFSSPGSGSGRSPKRKRSSMKETSDFSDECGIVPESPFFSNPFTAVVLPIQQ